MPGYQMDCIKSEVQYLSNHLRVLWEYKRRSFTAFADAFNNLSQVVVFQKIVGVLSFPFRG